MKSPFRMRAVPSRLLPILVMVFGLAGGCESKQAAGDTAETGLQSPHAASKSKHAQHAQGRGNDADQLGARLQELSGDVTINGVAAKAEQPVHTGDTVATKAPSGEEIMEWPGTVLVSTVAL